MYHPKKIWLNFRSGRGRSRKFGQRDSSFLPVTHWMRSTLSQTGKILCAKFKCKGHTEATMDAILFVFVFQNPNHSGTLSPLVAELQGRRFSASEVLLAIWAGKSDSEWTGSRFQTSNQKRSGEELFPIFETLDPGSREASIHFLVQTMNKIDFFS